MSSTRTQDSHLAVNWTNAIFLLLAHLLAAGGVLWITSGRAQWQSLALAGIYMLLCNISITAGYHRLFSHRSYEAVRWWKLLLLLFGAASIQNSALAWSRDHRRHHRFTDQDKDPYNVKLGFWWAHVLWVFLDRGPVKDWNRTGDLERDKLVMWQHRNYLAIAVFMGALLPLGLGLLWGDPIGTLLLVGFLRLVIQWHSTFFVNSLAHMVGQPTFNKKISARDSWVIALFTMGEGYHSFHHRFLNDYRNGHRWYHFDPTKWLLWSLGHLGVTRKLKRTDKTQIRQARIRAQH